MSQVKVFVTDRQTDRRTDGRISFNVTSFRKRLGTITEQTDDSIHRHDRCPIRPFPVEEIECCENTVYSTYIPTVSTVGAWIFSWIFCCRFSKSFLNMVVRIVLGAGSRLPDGGLGMMGLCNVTMKYMYILVSTDTLSDSQATDSLRRGVSAARWGSGYDGAL